MHVIPVATVAGAEFYCQRCVFVLVLVFVFILVLCVCVCVCVCVLCVFVCEWCVMNA